MPYIRLTINQLDRERELGLLQLIHHPLPFSRDLVRQSLPTSDKDLLLLEKNSLLTSLEEVLNDYIRKEGVVISSNLPLKGNSRADPNLAYLLYILNRQILYAREALIEPSDFWLKTGLIYCQPDIFNWVLSVRNRPQPLKDEEILDKLNWFVLPVGLDLEGLNHFEMTENIWQYLAQIDPAGADLYLENQELIRGGQTKAALNMLPEHQRLSQAREQLIQIEGKADLKKQEPTPKKSRRDRKPGFFAGLFKRTQAKPDFEEDITIALNPKSDLFRLAMISEGAPGTLDENEGLKAFILIDEFLIGRDKTVCDLVLEEETVGRVHARISRHGSHYFIEDLGSSNGSSIDGKKLHKHQTYLLPDHCRLKFAELPFYFTVD